MSLCSFGAVLLWRPLHRTLLCSGTFRQLSCYPLAHDGVIADGTFQLQDEQYTQSFQTKSQKVHANLGKIKERFIDYGISGLTRHSLRKRAVTWGDGSARYFLRTGENDRIQPLALLDSERADFMIVCCQAFRLATMLLAAVSLLSKHSKRLEEPLFPVALTLFGGIVFYLFWEAKAEYSIPFIPILLCLSADGVQTAQSFQLGAIPAKRIRQALLMCLSITIVLALCAFSSFTVQPVTQKKYSVDVHTENFSRFVNMGQTDISTISQTFYARHAFNTLKILAKANDTGSTYTLTLLQNGHTLYQTKLDDTTIADNYITLSIPMQKPKTNTRYELKISASDASKREGILFGYRLTKTLGNYPGSLRLDTRTVPYDLFLQVYQEQEAPYMSISSYLMFACLWCGMILLIFYYWRDEALAVCDAI